MPSTNVLLEDKQVVQSNCQICVNHCGISVHVKDGKVTKVEGRRGHPISRGHICPKGQAMVDWLYSPDRLRFPLKKENGEWKRISWNEALDTIATKLNAFRESDGARSVAIMTGSIGIEDREVRMLQRLFADGFGTPNFLELSLIHI